MHSSSLEPRVASERRAHRYPTPPPGPQPTPDRAQSSALYGWRAVAILSVLYLLSILDRQIIPLLLPAIKTDLHLSDVEVSLLPGLAFAIFHAAASIPFGWAVDRFDRRFVIFIGVTVWSLCATSSGLVRGFGALFAARAGVGAGEAALTPATYSLLADLFAPGRLALAISMFVLAGNLGTGISFILGGSIVQLLSAKPTLYLHGLLELHGWQIALIVTGIPGLIIGGLAFALHEPRQHAPRARTPSRSYTALFRFVGAHKAFYVCHNIGFALVMGAIVGVATWTPAFFVRTYGWKSGQIGLWLGLAMIVTAMTGMGIHGKVVDGMYRRGKSDAHLRWFAVMSVLGAVAAAVAYTVASPAWTIVSFGFFNIFVMGFPSIGAAALQIVTPKNLRGKASSIYSITLMFIGTAGGPSAVAALTDFVFHDEAKVGAAIAVMAVMFLLTAAVLFVIGLKPMRAAGIAAATAAVP